MSAAAAARLGLVVALEKEAAALGARSIPPDQVVAIGGGCLLYLCGAGPERAARAADALLDAGVGALLGIGTAGALSPELASGDVVLPEQVQHGNDGIAVPAAWRAAVLAALSRAPGAISGGKLLTVDRALAKRADKSAAFAATGAAAVDMESAAVLERAAARGARALVLRVILDQANTELPPAILDHCDAYGRSRLGALLLALVGNPRQLVPFLRVVQGYAGAMRTLRWIGRNRARLLPPEA